MGDRLATTDMGQKQGAAVPLFLGDMRRSEAEQGRRSTSIPSGILIHPAKGNIDIGGKVETGVVAFFGGEQGPNIKRVVGRGLPPCQVSY